jgi:hypothetical protein
LERQLTTSAARPGPPSKTIRVFYNVYAPLRNATAAAHAVAIVDEQFRQLRAAPMWPFVKEVRYATIGPRSIIDAVAARCEKLGTECVHLGHARVGNEANALPCVEINQCVGCTRQFFTKSFLGDDVAALARSSGEEPASPRHRSGIASMAWRTTR